ncbi:EI24 domain-containing protein OS=Streptomyces alboniger OX=132473 GN=CP975_10785 PE=4 SV=1 [Streptomyces alboniger]
MRDLGTGFKYLLKGQRWMAGHAHARASLITLVLYAHWSALALWGEEL